MPVARWVFLALCLVPAPVPEALHGQNQSLLSELVPVSIPVCVLDISFAKTPPISPFEWQFPLHGLRDNRILICLGHVQEPLFKTGLNTKVFFYTRATWDSDAISRTDRDPQRLPPYLYQTHCQEGYFSKQSLLRPAPVMV